MYLATSNHSFKNLFYIYLKYAKGNLNEEESLELHILYLVSDICSYILNILLSYYYR